MPDFTRIRAFTKENRHKAEREQENPRQLPHVGIVCIFADEISARRGEHAAELQQFGRETGRLLTHILAGLIIGALVSLREAYAQDAHGPLAVEAPMAPMLSRSTVNAVESAFNTLAHTVLSNNARTLEDLVKEMLRPMLKSWLDDNLPGLVERIVKAEIERVSRGR